MSKLDHPSVKQTESPISERSRAEIGQTAETITTSRKRKRITPVNRIKTNYGRILGTSEQTG